MNNQLRAVMLFHASEERVTSGSCRIPGSMFSEEFCRGVKLREPAELAQQQATRGPQVESSVTEYSVTALILSKEIHSIPL